MEESSKYEDLEPGSSGHDYPLLIGEPSMADIIAEIAADPSLPPIRKRHWLTSIRRLVAGIGRPAELLPGRMTSLRHPMSRLNAARMGITEKSLANHKSNVKAAVLHVMKGQGGAVRGAALSDRWKTSMNAIVATKPRRLLSGITRYCSSRGIPPEEMSSQIVEDHFLFREKTSFLETGVARKRELMKAWNLCVDQVAGWPPIRLVLPVLNPISKGPAWEAFPQGLRSDRDAYLDKLARPHHSADGKRRRSNRPATLRTIKAQVVAFARKAVELGTPIETLDSIAALLAPDVAQKVFEAYWPESDDHPSAYVINLASRLLAMARCCAGMPGATIESLNDTRLLLERDSVQGVTEKNLTVIRAVLTGDIWRKVKDLPAAMMAEAVRKLNRSPRKAAIHAARAIQILILSRAPVRIGNLMAIRIGTNLIRPGGDGTPLFLTFPYYDVKNRINLDYSFRPAASALIDRFIQMFRPHLGPRHREDWLFPGEKSHRSGPQASADIAKVMFERIGLRVTAHQFRHAAAALILRHNPSDFEFVRRVLGHRNVATTTRFYISLECFQANERFGQLIEERLMLNGETD